MEEEYKNELFEKIKGYKCLERVDGADKNEFINLMFELTVFDQDHPNLEFSVAPCAGFYVLTVKAWTSAIDWTCFYKKFLSKKRKVNVTGILSVQCIPSPDSEVGPLLKIRVIRSQFGTQTNVMVNHGHKKRGAGGHRRKHSKRKKKKTKKPKRFHH